MLDKSTQNEYDVFINTQDEELTGEISGNNISA
jgi:hypothetical protein